MTQPDMAHLVSEHAGQLPFVIRQADQSRIHKQWAARECESINVLVRNRLNRKWKLCTGMRRPGETLNQTREVIVKLRIVNYRLLSCDLRFLDGCALTGLHSEPLIPISSITPAKAVHNCMGFMRRTGCVVLRE